jgi:trans-aconitate 2-methyltransferase
VNPSQAVTPGSVVVGAVVDDDAVGWVGTATTRVVVVVPRSGGAVVEGGRVEDGADPPTPGPAHAAAASAIAASSDSARSLPGMSWDPDRYLRFEASRLRPALDLIARLPEASSGTVWDLGCGTGHITALLAERFPDADVHGLDSSAEMLAQAPPGVGVTWVEEDIAAWEPAGPVDMIFSNAALHWLPGHDALLPRLASHLAPEGVLAVQMPRNHDEPSHALLRELAVAPRWRDRTGQVPGPPPVAQPGDYLTWLGPYLSRIDIWETIYTQILEGDDPVAQWTRSTAALPFLEAAGDGADDFFAEYAAAVRAAYPRRPDGTTLFPFRRLFIVGRV